MVDFKKMAEKASERLEQSKVLASSFRGNDHLHRLGMKAVFLMEDIAFDLLRMANGETPSDASDASLKEPLD